MSGRTRTARLSLLEGVLGVTPVLDYDREVAAAHADLLVYVRAQGMPRGTHDLIIAATGKASGVPVSADESAFVGLPGVTVSVDS